MASEEFENKLKKLDESAKDNRRKIQDILPRTSQRDSLLAKIMGPRSASSEPERNLAGGFLRSLPLMRGKGGKPRLFLLGHGRSKPEKIIRLKKIVSPGPVSVQPEHRAVKEKQIIVPAARPVAEKPPTLIKKEVRTKIKESAPEVTDVSVGRPVVFRISLALGMACAAGGIVLLSTVFARATVSLEPSAAELALEGIRVEAGTGIVEIDAAGKKIPASLIETVGSLKREFSSSGKERVSRKATGVVRIYNAFSSAPQTLVAGTRFQNPSGRIFRLKQRVTVPGATVQNGNLTPRFISAGVEAGQAGAEFNIASSRFTIPGFAGTPKFAGFYAESQEAFAGGFEGEALVARQADIDAASEEVTAALFAQLKEELERKIPSGVTAIQGAREIIVTALRKPKTGDAADRFTVEADGTARVMLFRMDDLFALLGQMALAPDSGRNISPEKSHLEFDRASLSLKNRLLSFEIRGTAVAVSVVSPDDIGRALAGRTRADAENILRADSRVRAFGIGIFPPWRRTLPSDGEKIRILVRE